MLNFRVVVLSMVLFLFLAAYQATVPPATGPASSTLSAQALAAEKKEQKVIATVALPGVQVETMNPYGHRVFKLKRGLKFHYAWDLKPRAR